MPQHETYLGNPQLKAAYVPQDFTEEQIKELQKDIKDLERRKRDK